MKPRHSSGSRHTPMLAALLAFGLSGCATVNESLGDLILSSNANAVAVFDGRILRGKANFTAEREATFHLQSRDAPTLSCFGPLSYTATTTGLVNFACSDGRSALVEVHTLSQLTGTGRSRSGTSVFAMSYGLSDDKAAAYLGVAPDRLAPPRKVTSLTNGKR